MKEHSENTKIRIGSTPWGGLGVIAKEAIQKGEEVLRIHNDTVIGLHTALTHPRFGKAFSAFYHQNQLSEYALIALTLLWEKFDNERWSLFAPFLAKLPSIEEFHHPVLLSKDDLLHLYGSALLDEVSALNATLHREFEASCALIQSHKHLQKLFTSSLVTYPRFLVWIGRDNEW